MLDSNRIRSEIARLYDRDPQGWRVLVGKDKFGFFDAIIMQGADAWQVKEYQVNPYKFVGLGTKLPSLAEPMVFKGNNFGLRPIGFNQMKELENAADDPNNMSDLAARLLSQRPVASTEAMEGPAVLHGPVLQSPRPLDALSSAHSELDEKLRRELQSLVNRNFRHTTTPYI
ncbi:MAG: hypothetical protein ABSD41_08965 [Candidatus Bathyarchaeia archaeon]